MGIEIFTSSMSTLAHKKTNRILTIKDENGNWIYDNDSIKKLAVKFFANLYSEENAFDFHMLPYYKERWRQVK